MFGLPNHFSARRTVPALRVAVLSPGDGMDTETAREYVATLLQHFADELTEWEDGFVRSLDVQLLKDRPLTGNQARILDEVMERCARGHGRPRRDEGG